MYYLSFPFVLRSQFLTSGFPDPFVDVCLGVFVKCVRYVDVCSLYGPKASCNGAKDVLCNGAQLELSLFSGRILRSILRTVFLSVEKWASDAVFYVDWWSLMVLQSDAYCCFIVPYILMLWIALEAIS